MTPQPRGIVPHAEQQRLLAALKGKAAADEELKEAVAAALRAGGSVREVAKIAGLSTRTVQDWGRARGWPTPEMLARIEARKRQSDPWDAMLNALDSLTGIASPITDETPDPAAPVDLSPPDDDS